jgi:hypothetical protein
VNAHHMTLPGSVTPPGFQFGSVGCASPLALEQRACSVNVPDDGAATSTLHQRKPYLPWSGRSAAARQVDRLPGAMFETADFTLGPVGRNLEPQRGPLVRPHRR